MILIFEGPDCAGKSTMIEAVRQEHINAGYSPESVAIWHAGPFPQDSDAWTEYVVPLAPLSPSKDWLVLVDRWHIGELVYGPIFRGGSRLSLEQRRWIDGYVRSLGGALIHITARTEELLARHAGRGDDMVSAEQLEPIRAAFVQHIDPRQGYQVFTRTYDTTNQRTEPTAAAIYMVARQEVAIAQGLLEHPSRGKTYMERHAWPN